MNWRCWLGHDWQLLQPGPHGFGMGDATMTLEVKTMTWRCQRCGRSKAWECPKCGLEAMDHD